MLVKLVGQPYLWDGVIWEPGSILEIDDNVANYQIGSRRMEKAPNDAKRSDRPAALAVQPKHTPQATGEAIAEALVGKLGVSRSRKAEGDNDEPDDDSKGRKSKKHEF